MTKPVINSPRVKIMGVLNVTPDSFSDGGHYCDVDRAISHALKMIEEGADIIDVGGESTRPHHVYEKTKRVSFEEELSRVIPVIEQLSKCVTIPISIDTYKPEVMRRACDVGANMINDIYALRKPGALEMAGACDVPVVLMHMQGDPQTMQRQPHYENVVEEIKQFFKERVNACLQRGIKKENIILDPGFCFGKTLQHNCQLLSQLDSFKKENSFPLLVGLSRKSIIGKTLNLPVNARLYPSLALASFATLKGADIIRTHDVLATRQAVDMIKAVEAFQ